MELRLMAFAHRISQLTLLSATLEYVYRGTNFQDIAFKFISADFEGNMESFLKSGIVADISNDKEESLKKYLLKEYDDGVKKQISDYLILNFNQNYVMMCMYFELFLCHVLGTLISKKNDILLELLPERKITLKEILNAQSKDTILEKLIQESLDKYSHHSLVDKVKMHKKMGLDPKKYFDFSNLDPNHRFPEFRSYSIDILKEVWKRRNKIVHEDQLPIRTFMELAKINELFHYLIFRIAFAVSKKYDVSLDFISKNAE